MRWGHRQRDRQHSRARVCVRVCVPARKSAQDRGRGEPSVVDLARSQATNWSRNKWRKGCSNRYDSDRDLRSGTDCACLIPALQSPYPGGLAFKAEWLARRNTPLTKFSSPLPPHPPPHPSFFSTLPLRKTVDTFSSLNNALIKCNEHKRDL